MKSKPLWCAAGGLQYVWRTQRTRAHSAVEEPEHPTPELPKNSMEEFVAHTCSMCSALHILRILAASLRPVAVAVIGFSWHQAWTCPLLSFGAICFPSEIEDATNLLSAADRVAALMAIVDIPGLWHEICPQKHSRNERRTYRAEFGVSVWFN